MSEPQGVETATRSDEDVAADAWAAWKAALLTIATRDDMGAIDPESYREYFDDGYSPDDAWHEDQSYG